MKIDQALVDAIESKARSSHVGLSESHSPRTLAHYSPQDFDALALCLVSGWHDKYDLVSVFAAAIELAYQAGLAERGLSLAQLDHVRDVLLSEVGELCEPSAQELAREHAEKQAAHDKFLSA